MGENSAALDPNPPKLLKKQNPKQAHEDSAASSQNGAEEESSESYSDEDLLLRMSNSRPWKKKFGKSPRFLDADYYQDVFRAPPFCFQKRQARIDWRTLHAIDVDGLIQEIDLGKLETVLDTIAFGDIQGEDTRNFTEQNFIKLFRLAQLMIEYLLHVQGVLSEQKSQLLLSGAATQKKGEKLRLRCIWQNDALKQSQRDLKHAKKTLRTYEILLRSNGKQQAAAPQQTQTVHHCPCCEKIFESAYYLDLHVSRRHPKSSERAERSSTGRAAERAPEERSHASRGGEKTAAQVRAETEAVLQAEFERQHGASYEGSRSARGQVSSLHPASGESSSQDEAEYQLGLLSSRVNASTSPRSRQDFDVFYEDDEDTGRRLRDLEIKFEGVEHQIQHIQKDNIKLKTELDAAYRELSALRTGKRPKMAESHQVEDLAKQEQQLIKYMRRAEDRHSDHRRPGGGDFFTSHEHSKNTKSLSDWLSETDERFSDLTMGVTEEFHELEDARSRHSDGSSRRRQQFVDVEEDRTPLSDRERWENEHQFAPLPDQPYALSKFPHGASTVSKMSEQFDHKISAELKKFGISANASGISDEILKAAVATLERQRRSRYSDAPSSERRIMEYERSTIQWHIERAVRTRDQDRMESIFEEDSEPEDAGSSGGISDEEEGIAVRTPPRARSPRTSPRARSPRTSPRARSPRTSPRGGRSRSPSPPRGVPSSGFTEQFVQSKAFSWRADDDKESHTFRVTGEVIAQRVKSPGGGSEVHHKIVISPVGSPFPPASSFPPPHYSSPAPVYEDEQVEEDLGLGEWESDDGKASSPSAARSPEIARQVMRDIQSRVGSPAHSDRTAKMKGKQTAGAGTSAKSKQQQASSSNASDDIKMLDELDAEINDIIRM